MRESLTPKWYIFFYSSLSNHLLGMRVKKKGRCIIVRQSLTAKWYIFFYSSLSNHLLGMRVKKKGRCIIVRQSLTAKWYIFFYSSLSIHFNLETKWQSPILDNFESLNQSKIGTKKGSNRVRNRTIISFCVPFSVWFGVTNDAIIFGTFYGFWWRHKQLKWATTSAKIARLS